MSKAIAELDFFGMEKPKDMSASAGKSQLLNLFDQQRSFRGVHEAMCKMKPELLKSATLASMASSSDTLSPETTEPLTIFYRGTVSVFNVPLDMAENIIKAATGTNKRLLTVEPATQKEVISSENLVETFNREKLSRRISTQRFLQKRKER